MNDQVKKRGRPAKTAQEQKDNAHSPQGIRKRVPMAAGLNLSVPPELKDPNYEYRFFEDKPGRIQRAEEGGWESVNDKGGKNFVRSSGAGTLHLMRIPKEWYDEDQKLKEERIISTLKDEQRLKSHEYVPDGQDSVIQKDKDLLDPLA